jgi:leucyl-tRNA synthetase
MAEELWSRLGHDSSLAREPWPRVDPAHLQDESYELVVQVLGKLRARVRVARETAPEEAVDRARQAAERWLDGKEVVKVVHVPERLVNFVVR